MLFKVSSLYSDHEWNIHYIPAKERPVGWLAGLGAGLDFRVSWLGAGGEEEEED